jgi:hypothetical protein
MDRPRPCGGAFGLLERKSSPRPVPLDLTTDRRRSPPTRRLDFKKPWSDGTTSVDLEPLALIARLAALVPPPRRHLTRYCGVLSSHARLRGQIVPQPPTEATAMEKPARKSKYIPWAQLLQRIFGFEILCQRCQAPLRLIALIKNQDIAKRILTAMHLPTEIPQLHPARPPPRQTGTGEDFVN